MLVPSLECDRDIERRDRPAERHTRARRFPSRACATLTGNATGSRGIAVSNVQGNGTVIGTVVSRDCQTDRYELMCSRCRSVTLVEGIVDLLVVHTSARGRFGSPCCVGDYATGCKVGDTSEGKLIGAFMIDSGIETGFPIGIVLASPDEAGLRPLGRDRQGR